MEGGREEGERGLHSMGGGSLLLKFRSTHLGVSVLLLLTFRECVNPPSSLPWLLPFQTPPFPLLLVLLLFLFSPFLQFFYSQIPPLLPISPPASFFLNVSLLHGCCFFFLSSFHPPFIDFYLPLSAFFQFCSSPTHLLHPTPFPSTNNSAFPPISCTQKPTSFSHFHFLHPTNHLFHP